MAQLPSPRKKHRVREKPGSQLPISTDSSDLPPDGVPPMQVYRAYYEDGTITVWRTKEAEALWHNGYFGERREHLEDAADARKHLRKKRRKLMCVDDLVKGQLLGDDEEEGSEKEEENRKESVLEGWEFEPDEILERDLELSENKNKGHGFADQEKNGEEHVDEKVQSDVDTAVDSKRNKWRTVLKLGSRKAEPHPSKVHPEPQLTLLPAEAFFLSYALGCLVVIAEWGEGEHNTYKRQQKTGPTGRELTLDELWSKLTRDDPEFAFKYLVYHHYRTKGWVVKCGLKYGADWVLYPVGPPFYHAQYTVTIHCLWADTLSLVHNQPECQLDWVTLAATERVNTHVNKANVPGF